MKKGFTLIELVMVIAILGILAAMILPRFVDLSSSAKISAAKGALGAIRSAIAVTYSSNAVSAISPLIPVSLYPSMFQDSRIPVEPFSKSSSVTFVSDASAITAGSGWAYDSTNGRAWINSSAGTPSYTTY